MALKLQLKRNETPFESKEAAIEGLGAALANGNAGEIMIATYKCEDPYMYEIPLYDTDGGDTYIDWYKEHFDEIISESFFRMEFEGLLQGEEQILTERMPLLGYIMSSNWYYFIYWPMGWRSSGGVTDVYGETPILTRSVTNVGYSDRQITTSVQITLQDGSIKEGKSSQLGMPSSVRQLSNLVLSTDNPNALEEGAVRRFKLTFTPYNPVLKTDLYKDETNYSHITIA